MEGNVRDRGGWLALSIGKADDSADQGELLAANIKPRLEPLGLAWINFQALRRAHSSLRRAAGEDPKEVADQVGHGIGVNIDTYTITPLERHRQGVNRLAETLRAV